MHRIPAHNILTLLATKHMHNFSPFLVTVYLQAY